MNSHELSLREKNVVLIGFMGVGKTTIGKHVAKILHRSFIDADDAIEEAFGMSPSKVFAEYGEKVFRDKEREIITKLCTERKHHVISLGGGAFIQEEIKKVCMDNCIVIYLDLSWGNWKDRIGLIMDSRPVLQGRSLEEIEELFYQRKEYYAAHHLKIETDKQDPEEVATQIVDSLTGLGAI